MCLSAWNKQFHDMEQNVSYHETVTLQAFNDMLCGLTILVDHF